MPTWPALKKLAAVYIEGLVEVVVVGANVIVF